MTVLLITRINGSSSSRQQRRYPSPAAAYRAACRRQCTTNLPVVCWLYVERGQAMTPIASGVSLPEWPAAWQAEEVPFDLTLSGADLAWIFAEQWQPRWVAYLRDHATDPVRRVKGEGRKVVGFMSWIDHRHAEATKLHPDWFTTGRIQVLTEYGHDQFTAWLLRRPVGAAFMDGDRCHPRRRSK